ncbi:hypothetical protein [Paenibacillus sp. FSL R7-0273]|uniref:hypothetical protein n=1 Tax=Paenibacillus sp. FSL R7-0273 TaxID=1536772 RepID=UPI00069341AA|nr:hypothetical protein [Paenibacillus sp. FSL R7-0273]OMF95161.1 hypothetical protein BK144_06390 [Paenibacillus sp. FSL R7-0273]
MIEVGKGLLTNEERTMVRDLILLPYIDQMVGKSIEEIEHSGNVLRQTYIIAGRFIQSRIMQDIYALKQDLKRRNIKVVDDEAADQIMYFKILYRGYQERFGLMREVMKTEIRLRLTQYTAEVGQALQDHLK